MFQIQKVSRLPSGCFHGFRQKQILMGVQVMHPPDSDPDTPPELAAAPPVRPLLTVRKPFRLGSQENVNLHNLRDTNCFICTSCTDSVTLALLSSNNRQSQGKSRTTLLRGRTTMLNMDNFLWRKHSYLSLTAFQAGSSQGMRGNPGDAMLIIPRPGRSAGGFVCNKQELN